MPVLLTRPASAVARATAAALLDDGAQVRLFGPDAPSELRARGAFVASADHDDHGVLEAALAQVHTLVHVGPGLLVDEPSRLLHDAELVLGAAVRAGVERIVALSLPGADPSSPSPMLAAAGRVEELVAAAAPPSVVVRPGLVDTPALRDAVAALGTVPEDALVAPVRVEDLAAGLLAIDRARSRASSGHAVFVAPGPETMTVAEWLRRVGVRGEGGSTEFVGRVYRPGGASSPLRRALAGPWVDPPDAPVASLWPFAGIEPVPVG